MPHKTAGYGGIPWGRSDAPTGTTIIYDRDMDYFPEVKHSGYTKRVQVDSLFSGNDIGCDYFPCAPDKPQTCMQEMSATHVPIGDYFPVHPEMNQRTPTTFNTDVGTGKSYITSSRQHKIVKTVKVFDGIIMDETVNFALRYSSRMQQVSKEWHKTRNSDRSSLVSEKVVALPPLRETTRVVDGPVNITDISESSIYDENQHMNSGRLSSSSELHSSGVTDTSEFFVSPVSDVTLPVSPVNSSVHCT